MLFRSVPDFVYPGKLHYIQCLYQALLNLDESMYEPRFHDPYTILLILLHSTVYIECCFYMIIVEHVYQSPVLANSIIVAKCYCLLFPIPHIFCSLVSYPSSCMLQTAPSHTIFVVCFSPELLITTNFCASG